MCLFDGFDKYKYVRSIVMDSSINFNRHVIALFKWGIPLCVFQSQVIDEISQTQLEFVVFIYVVQRLSDYMFRPFFI